MSKSDRMYKIFMTTMVVVIAGLLLATGIIAIQKHMRLKAEINMFPSLKIEVCINEESNVVFRNFDDVITQNGISSLNGNTLTASESFLETYGDEFVILIKNYTTDTGFQVDVTASAITEGGHEGIMPEIIENKTQAVKYKNSTADYVSFNVSMTEVVFPQTTTLKFVFSEYNEYTVAVSPSSGNFTYTVNPVAIGGENYTANIKAKAGYNLSITVTRDGGTTTTLTAGQGNDYVWDSSTGALTIYASAVTGNITISCSTSANSYTVTLDNQSATTAGTASVQATYGSAMPSITIPAKTGYTFGGYYTSTNGGGTQYYTSTGASANNYDKASTLTLYAQWAMPSYTVNGLTFNASSSDGKYQYQTGTSGAYYVYYTTAGKYTESGTTYDVEWIVLGGSLEGNYKGGSADGDYVPNETLFLSSNYGTSWYATSSGFYIGGTQAQTLLLLSRYVLGDAYFYYNSGSGDANQYSKGGSYSGDLKYKMDQMYTSDDTLGLGSTVKAKILETTVAKTTYHNGSTGTSEDNLKLRFFPLGGDTSYNDSQPIDSFNVSKYFGSVTNTSSDAARKAYSITSKTSASTWWLRSGNYRNSGYALIVGTKGMVGNSPVYISCGVRPCFVFSLVGSGIHSG